MTGALGHDGFEWCLIGFKMVFMVIYWSFQCDSVGISADLWGFVVGINSW